MKLRTGVVGSTIVLMALVGCGGTSATPTSSSTSSSASSTTTTPTEPPTTDAATSTTATAMDTATAAALDAASTTWFQTMCTGAAPLVEALKEAQTAVQGGATDPKGAQSAVAELFGAAADTATSTAATLSTLPPPGVSGGPTLAAQFPPLLTSIGASLASATAEFKAANVTDKDSFDAAMSALNGKLAAALAPLSGAMATLSTTIPPDVQTAVTALPECAFITEAAGG